MLRRVVVNIIGTIFMGFGISLLLWLNLGVDTITMLYQGIQLHAPLSLWVLCILFNLVVVAIVYFVDRSEIGLGTILNFLVLSLCLKVFPLLFTGVEVAQVARPIVWCLLILAISIFAIGCGLYSSTELGSAALEALSISITNKTKISLKVTRIFFDGLLIVLAMLLGVKLQIATLLCLVLVGPIAQQGYVLSQKWLFGTTQSHQTELLEE